MATVFNFSGEISYYETLFDKKCFQSICASCVVCIFGKNFCFNLCSKYCCIGENLWAILATVFWLVVYTLEPLLSPTFVVCYKSVSFLLLTASKGVWWTQGVLLNTFWLIFEKKVAIIAIFYLIFLALLLSLCYTHSSQPFRRSCYKRLLDKSVFGVCMHVCKLYARSESLG